jgi:hypothetical protein
MKGNQQLSGPYVDYVNLISKTKSSDIDGTYSFAQAQCVLLGAIEDYPNEPGAYLELGGRAFDLGEYRIALSVLSRMHDAGCALPQGVKLELKCLLCLGLYEDAGQLYAAWDSELEGILSYQDYLDFLKDATLAEDFIHSKSAEFSKLFFIRPLINGNTAFLKKVSDLFVESYYHYFVEFLSRYVDACGARLLVASIDNIFSIANKSETEKSIIQSRIWERLPERIPWLKSCPPHVQTLYGDISGFSADYINEIFTGPLSSLQTTKVVNAEFLTKYVNVRNGNRVTTDTPAEYDNKIHLLGGSDVYGFGSEDSLTFASFLQRKVLKRKAERTFLVENHGVRGNPLLVCLTSFLQCPINPGDIVVLFGFPRIPDFVLDDIGVEHVHCDFSRPHEHGELFFDYSHIAWKGNKIVADTLYDKIFLSEKSISGKRQGQPSVSVEVVKAGTEFMKYLLYRKSADLFEVNKLDEYISQISKYKVDDVDNIGSVAVNCNPITLGHLHLLEYAASQVDFLYVFVIEEDLSFFSYEARFYLVKESVAHIKNCKVIPGGRYICTQFTYPEYYSKDESPAQVADASMEAWFFCEHIAKELGIKTIFLGEEPTCKVTRQYNDQMAVILPEYGIKVDIIPRIDIDGCTVSASTVRRLIASNDFAMIERIVPHCVYNYICLHRDELIAKIQNSKSVPREKEHICSAKDCPDDK